MKKTGFMRLRAGALAVFAAVLLLAGAAAPLEARAESGTIYSCTINRCYRHPVTGVIEDSGGEGAYTTGQGMVESAVGSSGMLEVTDSGNYYLTIRMSLMDYTTNQNFWVQEAGASSWSSTAYGVSATGTDSSGTTADVCIQVPSESCVVRGTMYVEPMGRDVIFYLYPSNYTEGNSVGMTATQVTEESGTTTETEESSTTEESGTTTTETTTTETTETTTSGSTAADDAAAGTESAPALSSSVEEQAAAAETEETTESDSALSSAQGLSLSTADEAAAEDTDAAEESGGMSAAGLGLAITISGLILICAAALVVYYFRVNWRRWGGGDDDDE